MQEGLNRRNLLTTLCASMLAPQLVSAATSEAETSSRALTDALSSLAGNSRLPRGARQIARKYRALVPHAREPNLLLAALESAASTTVSQVAEVFTRQRREDFARQRVVCIDGWLMARAEAELCELIAGEAAPA